MRHHRACDLGSEHDCDRLGGAVARVDHRLGLGDHLLGSPADQNASDRAGDCAQRYSRRGESAPGLEWIFAALYGLDESFERAPGHPARAVVLFLAQFAHPLFEHGMHAAILVSKSSEYHSFLFPSRAPSHPPVRMGARGEQYP